MAYFLSNHSIYLTCLSCLQQAGLATSVETASRIKMQVLNTTKHFITVCVLWT